MVTLYFKCNHGYFETFCHLEPSQQPESCLDVPFRDPFVISSSLVSPKQITCATYRRSFPPWLGFLAFERRKGQKGLLPSHVVPSHVDSNHASLVRLALASAISLLEPPNGANPQFLPPLFHANEQLWAVGFRKVSFSKSSFISRSL